MKAKIMLYNSGNDKSIELDLSLSPQIGQSIVLSDDTNSLNEVDRAALDKFQEGAKSTWYKIVEIAQRINQPPIVFVKGAFDN